MKIRDIINFLRSDMILIVKCDSSVLYEGPSEELPYYLAEKSFTATECIEAQNNTLIIDVSLPARAKTKNTDTMTNQKWMDTLTEEEVLLYLAGLLYHYDVGTVYEETYDGCKWRRVFTPMIHYVENRIGSIACSEKLGKWYQLKHKGER